MFFGVKRARLQVARRQLFYIWPEMFSQLSFPAIFVFIRTHGASSFLVDWLIDFAVGGPLLRQRIQLLLINGVHIQDHCVYLLV